MKLLPILMTFLISLSTNAVSQTLEPMKKLQKPKNVAKSKVLQVARTNPKAAIYRIKSADSGLCIGQNSKGLFDAISGNLGYGMGLATCDDILAQYAIIPRPDNTFTIRSFTGTFLNGQFYGDFNMCANVARNVIIGPAAIDINRCEQVPNPTSEADMGLLDQRFRCEELSDGYWQIKTLDNRCFDVRDHAKTIEAEIIKWDCTGLPNQKWQLIFEKDLPEGGIVQTLRNEGLY